MTAIRGHFHLSAAALCFLPAALLVCGSFDAPAATQVTASTGHIDLPTYPWAAVKHPYFRGTDKVNIYPYPMLDFLSRDKTNRTYRTVVLENEYLKITFLPELGGKIHEVLDKTTGQPMFYVNHVVKPGLIAQCGAWTSGGVEWNTGPQGHTVSCMQPVPVEILAPEKDGAQSVAVGETERIYGTRWTVVVTLRPGRSFIEERIRIYNPTETIRPYYFWNCTAAPNTPGFRFIYPMTLGCDHAGEKFFHWPIDQGKDLSPGTNYQDASSIFAWHCDQDFFGSYNDDLDHGVVSFANHYQLPGKKAWTWGYGGFGKMHQADLTDNDGPYNEVQTGPLLTQAQVGRLDPCEAVEWTEWWYPIHGLGGFTYANKDVAVNATIENKNLRVKIIGTGTWSPVTVAVPDGKTSKPVTTCKISPGEVTDLLLPRFGAVSTGATLSAGGKILARFEVPPWLPERQPPEKGPAPETASEWVATAWQDFLFARFPEAETTFRKALEKDPKSAEARIGLAFLRLDPDPAAAAKEAEAALEVDPDNGLAHLVDASAAARSGDSIAALEHAWAASLSPGSAAPGRAMAARILFRSWGSPEKAAAAVSGPGPWETDVSCRALRSFARHLAGDAPGASELAQANLWVEPLDPFSLAILWLAGGEGSPSLMDVIGGNPETVVELATQFMRLGQYEVAGRVLRTFYFDVVPALARDPLPGYLAGLLSRRVPGGEKLFEAYGQAKALPAVGIWPHDFYSLEALEDAVKTAPDDGKAALYLGHLLFHLGRQAEGREQWKRAVDLGAEPVVVCRALGMAAKTLDNDLKTAREWLEKGSKFDPQDAIVARDLANVLYALADQAQAEPEKRALLVEARDRLKAAFGAGKGRSDFVALLGRAQNRLGEFSETARMFDTVRVTVWEGSHEVHDLFVEAHLALGEARLRSGQAKEALAEFDRALEYPANLATGRLENAREAHIQYQRGNALAALGRKAEAAAAWKLAAEEPESKDAKINEAQRKAKEALAKAGG